MFVLTTANHDNDIISIHVTLEEAKWAGDLYARRNADADYRAPEPGIVRWEDSGLAWNPGSDQSDRKIIAGYVRDVNNDEWVSVEIMEVK